jgi:hypothetical protein
VARAGWAARGGYRVAVPAPRWGSPFGACQEDTGWEAGVPGACAAVEPPAACRTATEPAEWLVHRSVQLRESWQYHRTSGQALPPSGISRSVGRRIPHIQHDSMLPRAAGTAIR